MIFSSNRMICYFGLILTCIIWNVQPFMEKKDKFWSGTTLAILFVENLFFWLFMVIMSIGLAETVILLVESTNLMELTSHWLNLKFFICLHWSQLLLWSIKQIHVQVRSFWNILIQWIRNNSDYYHYFFQIFRQPMFTFMPG